MGEIKQLGRYEIVRVLGSGAMGLVYEARDSKLHRRVAIKTISKHAMADAALEAEYSGRFMHEARSIASLNHPNIVTVYDFGEEGDAAYLVMEFIQGRELKQYLDGDVRFTLQESLGYMIELLNALDYAHARGIVHRDIKPANIMIDSAGRLKLTDFGVAKTLGADDGAQAGPMAGTPSYMSPEQILGESVTPQSDIFAAGVVCYQLLTWQKPFWGESLLSIQHLIVSETHAPPSSLNPALPSALDRIVARALAKKPEQRYARAGEFVAEIKRYLSRGVAPAGTMLAAGSGDAALAAQQEAACDEHRARVVTEMLNELKQTHAAAEEGGDRLDRLLPRQENAVPVHSFAMALVWGFVVLVGAVLLLTLGAWLFGQTHSEASRHPVITSAGAGAPEIQR